MFPSEVRFTPHFTITNRITSALTRIERARGFLEAAALSEECANIGVVRKHRGRVFILHIMPKSVNNEDTTPLSYGIAGICEATAKKRI